MDDTMDALPNLRIQSREQKFVQYYGTGEKKASLIAWQFHNFRLFIEFPWTSDHLCITHK